MQFTAQQHQFCWQLEKDLVQIPDSMKRQIQAR